MESSFSEEDNKRHREEPALKKAEEENLKAEEAARKKAEEEEKRRQGEEQQLRRRIEYVSTLDRTQLNSMTWSELYEIVKILQIKSYEVSKNGFIQAILKINGHNASESNVAKKNVTIQGKRLVKVAQELNVATSTIVEFLGTKGCHIENKPTSIVPEEMESILHQEFQADKATKIKADAMTIGVRPLLIRKANEDENIQDPFADLMVKIEGGTFYMGDTFGDGDKTEQPVHKVTVKDFYLCKYPVTQAAWKKIMGNDNNPSGFKGDDLPVENVNWNDAQDFIKKLNEKTGGQYRLPTEAEWEYAAREGGKKVRFGNGKDIADPKEINFNARKDYKKPYSIAGEYRGKTTPVGSLNCPNSLGLHDMSGNVWEWCEDVWHENYKGAPTDGSAWLKDGDQEYRVLRGGSWPYIPGYCRSAFRNRNHSAYRNSLIGFRLVSLL